MELPVGLGNTELQLAAADGVDVVHRTTSGFDRAADAVLFAARFTRRQIAPPVG
jgi:hypothetical protein